MKQLISLLPAVMLACLNGFAQQPTTAYKFRVIVEPQMTIAGHKFAPDTVIGSVALNDVGEVAFTAIDDAFVEVFTSKRIVAESGDAKDGKYIVLIPLDAVVAINNAGQVAYHGWYTDTREPGTLGNISGLGIFVENHLAFTQAPDSIKAPFTLSDDGQVIRKPEAKPSLAAADPAPPDIRKAPRLLDQIHINPPKGFPTNPGQKQHKNQQSQPNTAPALQDPFPVLRTNRRGQILVSVNFEGGFLLLLGTPVTH